MPGGPAGGAVVVKDTDTLANLFLPAVRRDLIDSSNDTCFPAGPTVLVANYAGSSVIEVEIISSYCPGGICLSETTLLEPTPPRI